jgi:hypothetical protein
MQYELGIYLNMPHEEYVKIPALSCSGIKKLLVSPLHFWEHSYLNPDYVPEAQTPAMMLGTMRHKYLLENDTFFDDYFLMPNKADFPDALDTVEDLKDFMREHEIKPLTGNKSELIQRIKASGHKVAIWDDIEYCAKLEADGRKILYADEMKNLEGSYKEAMEYPAVKELLSGGLAEVTVLWIDSETSILMKARFDYIKPKSITDYKTFSNSGEFPIDLAVNRALMTQRYHLQTIIYLGAFEQMKSLPCPDKRVKEIIDAGSPTFSFLFQIADAPHDVRIRDMARHDDKGSENVYWIKARSQVRQAVETYARYYKTYGNKKWHDLDGIRSTVKDLELPWLMNDFN